MKRLVGYGLCVAALGGLSLSLAALSGCGKGHAATPPFVVTRTDPVRIFVEVPEADAPLVARPGALADGQEVGGH